MSFFSSRTALPSFGVAKRFCSSSCIILGNLGCTMIFKLESQSMQLPGVAHIRPQQLFSRIGYLFPFQTRFGEVLFRDKASANDLKFGRTFSGPKTLCLERNCEFR